MKQKEVINEAWVFTIIYWIIGMICFFWGGIKYIGNTRGAS